jgi:hypothetical protein
MAYDQLPGGEEFWISVINNSSDTIVLQKYSANRKEANFYLKFENDTTQLSDIEFRFPNPIGYQNLKIPPDKVDSICLASVYFIKRKNFPPIVNMKNKDTIMDLSYNAILQRYLNDIQNNLNEAQIFFKGQYKVHDTIIGINKNEKYKDHFFRYEDKDFRFTEVKK